jgi:hypothetical protein
MARQCLDGKTAGTQFTCFTGTKKVQILTQLRNAPLRVSVGSVLGGGGGGGAAGGGQAHGGVQMPLWPAGSMGLFNGHMGHMMFMLPIGGGQMAQGGGQLMVTSSAHAVHAYHAATAALHQHVAALHHQHAFEKHREYMWGTCVPFSAIFSTVETKIAPVMAYSIQLPKLISPSKFSRQTRCVGGQRYPLSAPTGESEITGLFLHERLD